MTRIHQPSLEEAMEERDKAIDQAERNADEQWKHTAMLIIRDLAQSHHSITSDTVWAHLINLGVVTHEPRALGALMRKAAKAGWIEATDRYIPSHRGVNHARPVRVWKCLR